MLRLKLRDAAALARATYGGQPALPPLQRMTSATVGAEAYLTRDGILLIPGTNEGSDWTDYNLKGFAAKGEALGWDRLNPGIGAAVWHFGFALHAIEVMDFLGGLKPAAIIGHSLGAASAQMLGAHFKVPTVTFAAPRLLRQAGGFPGEEWVLNLVHSDDVIGLVLAQSAGFRRVGHVRFLTAGTGSGFAHAMADYETALAARLAAGTLSPDWPPTI
jgi:pimeloyl-ACP methyl ester carboxylesterase